MPYDSSTFSGLTFGSTQSFFHGSGLDIQLATGVTFETGWIPDGPHAATFTYDDTAFGHCTDGLNYRLATNSGNHPLGILPTFAQIRFVPPFFTSANPDSTVNTLTDLIVTMPGFGTVDVIDDFASNAAGSIVKVGDSLPRVSVNNPWPGRMLLMRPSIVPTIWSGRDDSNQALSTLWLVSEIVPMTYTFSLIAENMVQSFFYETDGWIIPT